MSANRLFDGLEEARHDLPLERAAIRVFAGERKRGLHNSVAILRQRVVCHECLRAFDGFHWIMRQHALIEGPPDSESAGSSPSRISKNLSAST